MNKDIGRLIHIRTIYVVFVSSSHYYTQLNCLPPLDGSPPESFFRFISDVQPAELLIQPTNLLFISDMVKN